MKKALHITVTILVMLIAYRFFVRIVDAIVQIGEDLGVLTGNYQYYCSHFL